MKTTTTRTKKLSISKTTLKNLTVRAGIKAGALRPHPLTYGCPKA